MNHPEKVTTRVDDLLRGALRWTMRAAIIFRLVAAVGPLSWVAVNFPSATSAPVLAVGVVVLGANAVVLVQLVLTPSGQHPHTQRLLVADILVAIAVNLWSVFALPGSVNEPYHDVFFFLFLTTIGMWTLYGGPRAGATVLALTVPLQVLMTVLDGSPVLANVAVIAGRTTWLTLALISVYLIVVMLRKLAVVALAEGERAGRQAAQIQTLRSLHDTVLQTLEGIGMLAGNRRLDSEDRLEGVRVSARRQAADLRSSLRELLADPAGLALDPVPTDLRESMLDIAARLSGLGLRLDVRGETVELPPATGQALRYAVQEAVSNALRHAGTDRVAVRLSPGPDRVEVVVRDGGRGFDPDDPALARGFGLAHSIHGRMRDVGGHAEITSRPGAGTTVRLWVPWSAPAADPDAGPPAEVAGRGGATRAGHPR